MKKTLLSIFLISLYTQPLQSLSFDIVDQDIPAPSEGTYINSMDDLRAFQGQIVAYTTDNPTLKMYPNMPVQYAVVTEYETSDQNNFAADLFPLVLSGIENYNSYALKDVDLNNANIRMRQANQLEYAVIFYLLTHNNLFFACDLFEFEQRDRIDTLSSVTNLGR